MSPILKTTSLAMGCMYRRYTFVSRGRDGVLSVCAWMQAPMYEGPFHATPAEVPAYACSKYDTDQRRSCWTAVGRHKRVALHLGEQKGHHHRTAGACAHRPNKQTWIRSPAKPRKRHPPILPFSFIISSLPLGKKTTQSHCCLLATSKRVKPIHNRLEQPLS